MVGAAETLSATAIGPGFARLAWVVAVLPLVSAALIGAVVIARKDEVE